MVKWIKKMISPSTKTILKSQIDEFVKENKNSLIGFFTSNEDKEFIELSDLIKEKSSFENFPTAVIFDTSATKELHLYTDFNVKPHIIPQTEFKNLLKQINIYGYPLVEQISETNFQRYLEFRIITGLF
jgi:hypothetical protein